ncbi:MAG TPA: hypothetical protein VH352_04790 [Pseudonocardiaceae bacterium]|jgi:hypothetical protein|nr:hypothetical protein [Pseudonocardiaceae bacterium]
MTATRTSELDGVTVRERVGARDLLWLTWRQHRWMIVSGAVLAAALAGYILWNAAAITPGSYQQCGGFCLSPQFFGLFYGREGLADLQIDLTVGFGWMVAVFWAAPLLAREYDQRTNLLAWSQDVASTRWLAGKVVPLVVVAVGLAAALGAAAGTLGYRLVTVDNSFNSFNEFSGFHFEAYPPLQMAYALFGFALGLAMSALVRRTVPAMAGTAVLYIGVRVAVYFARPYYLPVVRATGAPGDYPFARLGRGNLDLANGDLDSAGNVIPPDQIRLHGDPGSFTAYQDSLRRDGVVATFTDYQPAYRLVPFRLIETGIFVLLAAALFTVVWLRMRRSTSTS